MNRILYVKLILILTLLSSGLQLRAQQKNAKVTGTVLSEKGESLIGVHVKAIELSTTKETATMTDESGEFSLEGLHPENSYHFEFSSMGYQTAVQKNFEMKKDGENLLLVRLTPANSTLDDIVITALGIKREEKSLGYATQVIGSAEVLDAKSNNWANTLSGKVAGLNIQGTGAGPMGSSRITLRGESSLNLDNNQALVVIDGVPISNRITGTGFNSHLSADNPIDFGSNVSDINPDDIEKVTVLKGPAATALYGSRAAGGALIITTKSGNRKQKGLGVTINSNISIEQVNRWPDYQFEYGEGRTSEYYSYGDSPDGPNTSTTVAAGRAWGPKFNGQMYYQYNPASPDGLPTERTPWVADKHYISDYFKTGVTASNSVAVEGGDENGGARLSLTHLTNKWILPNTEFQRINASFSAYQKISDRLKINGKINYVNKSSDNLPSAGYNNNTIMYFLIAGTAPSIRADWFKPYWVPGKEGIQQRSPFNSGPDNPYLDMYEMLNKMNKHNVIGNINATYKITNDLDVLVRSGVDFSSEFRSQQRPYSMTKYPKGMYREQTVTSFENNTDLLLSYRKQVTEDWNLSLSAGSNIMYQSYNFAGMYADQLAQPAIYQLSNSLDPVVVDPQRSEKSIASVYAFGQLAYKDKVFLDITGRNDWSSTLPAGQRSFFYPSVNLSLVLSEMWTLPQSISFAKVRASWAQVGNDTKPYQTAKYYDQIYSNGLTNASVKFNPNLKPEITSSYEAGVDIRMFSSRIGLDVTVYTNNSRNQILATPVDPVSGFTSALINAGLINSKGIEVVLNTKPIAGRKFKWNSTLNWSMNRSYVRELADGITSQIIYDHSGNVTIEARVGGRMGDLYGRGFQRAPDGQIIYNSLGLPESLDAKTKKWGNAFADWKAGWMNEFTYKNFHLNILLDGQMGGSIYSQTNHKNNTLGKTKITLPGREDGIIGDGVVKMADGSYVKNTTKVKASTYYENYYQISNAETNIFSASFLKIREVRLSYNIPEQLLKRIKLQGASVALWGRDLYNFTAFPGFDPEGGNLNNGTLTPGVELTQFPSTRSIGFNLTLKF